MRLEAVRPLGVRGNLDHVLHLEAVQPLGVCWNLDHVLNLLERGKSAAANTSYDYKQYWLILQF